MKIIIVGLSGGLGNQLFEYAVGRMLADKYNGLLFLDASGYTGDVYGRNYMLDRFQVKAKIFRKGVWKNLITPGNRIYAWGKRLNLVDWKTEKSFTFHEDVFYSSKTICYLAGFWQTQDYFAGIRPLLLKELQLSSPIKNIREIITGNAPDIPLVSVHVRYLHGVYADKSLPRDDRYGNLGKDYYLRAMNSMIARVGRVSFVIFSDDIAWCKENLHFENAPVYFIDDYNVKKDYEQLVLMSQCDHQIVANSTFSWWGAWLCNSNENIVIRPQRPFNDPSLLYEGHFPEKWVAC